MQSNVSQIPGNTPINTIPLDYYPKGCGYWLKLSEGLDKGKKLFFSDSNYGNGKPKATVVFIHGNPECSYTYRKIIRSLVKLALNPFRIINMDHIGFGLSNCATYEMVSMDHSKNLFQLIKALDLNNVTLVVHDWGGPIGVGAFLKEPHRVSNLVVLNSTVFPFPLDGKTYKNYPISWLGWAKSPLIIPNRFWGAFVSFVVFLNKTKPLSILTRMIKYIILAKMNLFPKDEIIARKLYMIQFRNKLNTLSSKRLVLQTPKWGHGNTYKDRKLGRRNTFRYYRFIQKRLKKVWGSNNKIGVKAIFGGWDAVAKKEVLNQWLKNLPQLKGHIKIFPKESHFIQESKPLEIAKEIINVSNLSYKR